MSYEDRVNHAMNDEDFRGKVQYCMVSTAIAIRNEAASSNTPKRQALATSILALHENINSWSLAISSDTTIGGKIDANPSDPGILDSEIENAVIARYNAYAGIYLES